MTTIRKQVQESLTRDVKTTDAKKFLVTDPATGREVTAGGGSRDSILSALPVGKAIAGGRIWEGDLRPVADFFAELATDWETPFTIGNILHAEPGHARIDPGKIFDDIAKRAAQKAAQFRATSDATGQTNMRDLNRRLNEQAREFWKDSARPGAPTGNSPPRAPLSGTPSNAELNRRARAFWDDSSAKMRSSDTARR